VRRVGRGPTRVLLPSGAVRAVYATGFGGQQPLAHLEVGEQPEPGLRPGWALVRVTAASLNHHDLWTLRGVSSRPLTPPQILGCDAAGRVLAVGEGAEGAPAEGTRVVVHSVISCGSCSACLAGRPELCHRLALLSEPPHGGTLADTLAVPAANLIALPDAVSDEDAACLPTAYLTAYRMLFTRGRLEPGMSVLVQGAGGGVATAAIVLARAAGIEVYATSRDPAKRRAAEGLGAAGSFAPDDREAAKALLRRTGGGVDTVIETVGEATWELSLRSARPGGTVVVAGATSGANPGAQLNRIFWRQLTVAGTTMGTRQELERLVRMCAARELHPVVDRVVALAEAPSAFAALAAGERTGKLVVRID
jgi:NADPH:quinone reductase-like Zn-dependent oxidoreductase